MGILKASNEKNGINRLYATRQDFQRLFAEHTRSLYLLALTLTADEKAAERCFLESLETCMNGNPVSQNWALSWARRVIVHQAIRTVNPHPNAAGGVNTSVVGIGTSPGILLGHNRRLANILALSDFDRFVYVLSILERFHDHDCALLLEASQSDINDARVRAIRQMTSDGVQETEKTVGQQTQDYNAPFDSALLETL